MAALAPLLAPLILEDLKKPEGQSVIKAEVAKGKKRGSNMLFLLCIACGCCCCVIVVVVIAIVAAVVFS